MYANRPPPPSSLADELGPLRLPAPATQSLPSGGCGSISLSSDPIQRCACQAFHLDSGSLGPVCHCGHHACFHSGQSSSPPGRDNGQTHIMHVSELQERVRRLEDALKQERDSRERAMMEERRARDREIRILREALHPFYRSEEEMRRNLIDIEDRLERGYDEHAHMQDRIINLDDAQMALEKRFEDLEPEHKRRRTRNHSANGTSHSAARDLINGHESKSDSDLHRPRPMALDASRMLHHTNSSAADPDEPRSSGILDLIHPQERQTIGLLPPRQPSPVEEARSSGFLEISLAERLASRMASTPPSGPVGATWAVQAEAQRRRMSSMHSGSTLEGADASSGDDVSKKRKRSNDFSPLKVLADLSAASPMV